jgi:hypothetical protein
MFGRPSSPADFRRIKLTGGTIILLAAVLAPVALRLWHHPARVTGELSRRCSRPNRSSR